MFHCSILHLDVSLAGVLYLRVCHLAILKLPATLFPRLCIDYVLPATIIFVGTAAIVVIYGFYLVYVYRDVPDLLGLRKEVVYVYSITAVLGFTGYGLQVTDAAEFSTQDPQSFDWVIN